ncbi:hypothetical protein BJ165DRAFT_1401144 [Panaeolus papilionaceus]|nr:hypothetical protein BJ165DRAFT_1401144 [Panaeolus papilionaceus]
MTQARAAHSDCHLEMTTYHHSDDIVIAVMGRSGHGKTSFLHYLSQSRGEGVAVVDPGSIQPSENLSAYRLCGHERYNNRLVFVDEPGFDTDSGTKWLYDIVGETKDWMKTKYGSHKKVAGVIYLYAFNDQHNSAPHPNALKESPLPHEFSSMAILCPTPDCVKFVSWVWDTYPNKFQQEDVVENFTKTRKQLTGSAEYIRFWSDEHSAWEIVSSIADKPQVSMHHFPHLLESRENLQQPRPESPPAPSLASRLGFGLKKVLCCTADVEPAQGHGMSKVERKGQVVQAQARRSHQRASEGHSRATSFTGTLH